jgi:hypothetical protein
LKAKRPSLRARKPRGSPQASADNVHEVGVLGEQLRERSHVVAVPRGQDPLDLLPDRHAEHFLAGGRQFGPFISRNLTGRKASTSL